MSLDHEITQAESVRHWLQQTLYGLEISNTPRSLLAAGCFDTVIEHQQGIVLLIRKNLCAPAFALVRTTFESYVRGLWLNYCATEADLTRFKNDKIKSTFSEMISTLESLPQFSIGVLSGTKTTAFGSMSSYAHGGLLSVCRRIGFDAIEPQYNEKGKLEVLRSTTSYSMLSGIEIALLAERAAIADAVLGKLTEYAQATA